MLRRSEFRNGAPSVVAPAKKRASSGEKLRARHQRFYEYRRQRQDSQQENVRIEGRSDGEETPAAEETPNEVTSDDESSTIQQPAATPPPPPPPAQTPTSTVESTTTSAIPPPPPPPQTTTSPIALPIVEATSTSTPQPITTQPPQIPTSTPRTFSTTFTPKDHSPAPIPTALPIVEESRAAPSSTTTSKPLTTSSRSQSSEATFEATSETTSEATSTTEQSRPTITTPTVKEEVSTTFASKVTATSSILSTATAVAGGLGGPSQTDRKSGLSGVAMALIIIGVLLSAILMIGLAYAFVKRSIIFARLRDRTSRSQSRDPGWPQPQQQPQVQTQLQTPTYTQSYTPLPPPPPPPVANSRTTMFLGMPVPMPFRSQEPATPMTESHDNRIWGGASTVDTETLVEYPSYVPPLMQKGGVYDPDSMQDARSEAGPHPALIDPALFAPPAPPRQSVLRHQSRYTESSRDSVMTSTTSTTLSSIPRFRTIKSWTQDQRRRVQDAENVPSMPRRTYERL